MLRGLVLFIFLVLLILGSCYAGYTAAFSNMRRVMCASPNAGSEVQEFGLDPIKPRKVPGEQKL